MYTDTDTQSLLSLPLLDAPLGILCKKKDKLPKKEAYQLKKTYPDFSCMILYDFMAATSSNPILQIAANISKYDYQFYHDVKQDDWEYIDCDTFHLMLTCVFTGSTLRAAINYWTKNEKIDWHKSKQLFFNDKPFFLSTYDKSWLSHDLAELEEEEALKHLLLTPKLENIFLKFAIGLENNRDVKFPLPILVNQPISNDLDNPSHDNELAGFDLASIMHKTKQQLYVKRFLALAVAVGLFHFANKSGLNGQQSLLLLLGSVLLVGGGYHVATKKRVLYHPGLFGGEKNGFTLPICDKNTNIYEATC